MGGQYGSFVYAHLLQDAHIAARVNGFSGRVGGLIRSIDRERRRYDSMHQGEDFCLCCLAGFVDREIKNPGAGAAVLSKLKTLRTNVQSAIRFLDGDDSAMRDSQLFRKIIHRKTGKKFQERGTTSPTGRVFFRPEETFTSYPLNIDRRIIGQRQPIL